MENDKKLSPKTKEMIDVLRKNIPYMEFTAIETQIYEAAPKMSNEECDIIIEKVKKRGILGYFSAMLKLVNMERKNARKKKKENKKIKE